MYERLKQYARDAVLVLEGLAALAVGGCATQTLSPERTQEPAPVEQPVRPRNPFGFGHLHEPSLTDRLPPDTRRPARPEPPREPAVSYRMSSNHFGFGYLHEGPTSLDGTIRSVPTRVGIAAANQGLALVDSLPYIGWAMNDGDPQRDLGFFEGYFGFDKNGDAIKPEFWDATTWLVGVVRFPVYCLDRALGAAESAAYGSAADPRWAAGIPLSVLREPFRWTNQTALAAGDHLVGGRKCNDLVTGGASVPAGQSVWDDSGEAIGRRIVNVVTTHGTVGAGIYFGLQSTGKGGSAPAAPSGPVIDIPGGPGIQ